MIYLFKRYCSQFVLKQYILYIIRSRIITCIQDKNKLFYADSQALAQNI